MGSSDSVCSFSKVQVSYNDDIVAVYVSSGISNARKSEKWNQVGFPIFGQYNDYGNIHNFDTSHINVDILKNTCEVVKSHIHQMERGYYADNPELMDVFMHNVVQSEQMLPTHLAVGNYVETENGKYKIEKHNGNKIHICFIHRNVYDYVVSVGSKYSDDVIKTADIDTYFDLRRQWNRDGKIVYIDGSMIYGDEENFDITKIKNAEYFDHNSVVGNVHYRLLKRANDCNPSITLHTTNAINAMVTKLIPELTSEHPLVKSLIENQNFRTGRMLLNLELVPHFSYVINQCRDSDDLRRSRDFCKMVTKFTTELIRKNKEYE